MQPNDPHGGPTWPAGQGQAPYGAPSPPPYGQQPAPHGQAAPAPYGQAPYGAPPPYGQQAAPPYAQAPPPYAPAPYLQQTDAAREAKQQKAKRDIAFGVVWLVVGLLITGVTMGSGSSVYIVAWGPMLYGIYKIIKGVMANSSNKG